MALSVDFASLKKVDRKTKYLVTGFIRNVEKQLDQDMIIPALVLTTCILFYHLKEFFVVCGDEMIIDEKMTTVSILIPQKTIYSKFKRNTVYGNIGITNKYNCIYSWTLKILQSDIYDILIGIDASNRKYVAVGFAFGKKDEYHYALSHKGRKYVYNGEFSKRYGKFGRCQVGDIIKMILNSKKKSLSYEVNDTGQGIAFDGIKFDDDTEYNFAVSMCSGGLRNAVQLIDFEQVFLK